MRLGRQPQAANLPPPRRLPWRQESHLLAALILTGAMLDDGTFLLGPRPRAIRPPRPAQPDQASHQTSLTDLDYAVNLKPLVATA